MDDIYMGLHKGKDSGIFLDIKKVFYTVDHEIILFSINCTLVVSGVMPIFLVCKLLKKATWQN